MREKFWTLPIEQREGRDVAGRDDAAAKVAGEALQGGAARARRRDGGATTQESTLKSLTTPYNRAHHRFLVKRPQVLKRAAATPDNHYLGSRAGVERCADRCHR